MPKLQDLIAKCKDEEMSIQNLEENAIRWDAWKGRGQVTFLTDPEIIHERMSANSKPRVGIVIWFPHDIIER